MASEGTRDHASDPALQQVVERFDDASGDIHVVRDDILLSWRRSVGAGLRHDRLDVPFDGDIDDTGRLGWAAASVIDRIASDLEDARMGLLLTDHRAHVVDRRAGAARVIGLLDRIDLAPGFLYTEARVGTNAIGTALETSAPSIVLGQEHFADALIGTACTAVPITDPASGRVIGVVDLTSAAEDANPLMLPLAKRAAWEIEQRLLDAASERERVLHDHFVKARRTTRVPMALVSDRSMFVNGPAAGLLQASDRGPLWDVVSAQPRGALEVSLTNGRSVVIRSEAVVDGGQIVGALIRLSSTQTTGNVRADRHGTGRAAHGWLSLSDTERTVADLVAGGLTNREAAGRLFLSPHTVDFHLRHIYGKLDVRSRVELTRVVLEREAVAVYG
jgi:transcriptional regulator of acetoin/glycerol metabolism/DNA-binding CsgD family transcriptional regulator